MTLTRPDRLPSFSLPIDVPPMPPGDDHLRLLYVAGWGRSGSTLLARMLAELPTVAFVGEVRDVWLRGALQNQNCGCGHPFRHCSFWTAVGQKAFGGWDEIDPQEMLALQAATDRPWRVPSLLEAGPRRGRLAAYVHALGQLYHAIQSVSGASVVVDSSKIPSFALIVAQIDAVDLRIVHLVRDSRGAVFSWQKRAVTQATPTYRLLPAAARYSLYNCQTHLLGRRFPYLLLRYEDLVADPRASLHQVLSHLDVAAYPLSFLDERSVEFTPSHSVSGNPMRFQTGRVALRLDDTWRRDMALWKRSVVTVLTSPLLARYGYPLRSHGI